MNLLPRTLLGRMALVIIASLIISQALSLLVFREYNRGPQSQLSQTLMVSHLKTIKAALESLPPEQHKTFIDRIKETEGIQVISQTAIESPPGRIPKTPQLQSFNKTIQQQLGEKTELFVQNKPERTFWVRLSINDKPVWVTFPRTRVEQLVPWAWLGWGTAGLALALFGAYFVARRVNQPMQLLADAANKIGRGEYPQPIPETGPAEIQSLAHTFNKMNADLLRLDHERALLLAGVSHDLRTPLARLRLGIEMLGDKADPKMKSSMEQDIEDMNRIIAQFLNFAQQENTEAVSEGSVNELVQSVCARFVQAGKKLRVELGAIPTISFRPLALRRLLNNLIENALRYADGDITVQTKVEHNQLMLSVLDHGPGIPLTETERLKQPFTRMDSSRGGETGSGLGLAIVERIAQLHHAKFELLPREGGGLEARISFLI
jgi:two-component system, OmpR family, osmolarity sensor histidine kinase EnvZ